MSALLEIKNLNKSFGGIHAVSNVSFSVEKGEILGLIGPNGSGKSTCVNLISGVYTPDSGDIIFDGKSLKGLSIPQRSLRGIGRTFQTPKPFIGLNVFDSVYTIAMHKNSYQKAAEKTTEVLKEMHLYSLAETPCQKLPIEKRKWLDLARIMVTDPKIILMDEVMAGLNPSEIQENIDLVKEINNKGITILFIEHVMKAVTSLCERIVVLNEGQLLISGNQEQVMNDPRVVSAYLGGGYKGATDE